MADKKNIADMTDAEIDALPPDELLALQTGGTPDGDDEGDGDGEGDEGGEGDGEGGDAGDGEGDADGDGDGDAGGDSDDEPELDADGNPILTAEQLRAFAEADVDDDDDDGGEMVPRARLNQSIERTKDYQLMLRFLLDGKAAMPAAPVEKSEPVVVAEPEFLKYDFKAKSREMIRLITEGKDDEAATLSDEIENTREQVQQYKLQKTREDALQEANQTISQTEQARLNKEAMKSIYDVYPFLNNTGKDANEAAILAVNAKARQLVQSGKAPHDALLIAAKKIGGEFAKLLKPTGDAGSKDGKPGKKTATPAKDTRTAESIKRNLNVRQPATQRSGVGNRETDGKLDIRTMTDAQLDALEKNDPAAFAELRGDNRIG